MPPLMNPQPLIRMAAHLFLNGFREARSVQYDLLPEVASPDQGYFRFEPKPVLPQCLVPD